MMCFGTEQEQGGDSLTYWETLCPGGLGFFCEDEAFRPGTDSFLLSSLPRLKPGLRVCDLGSGGGLLGVLLLQRQRDLTVTGVEMRERAVRLAERTAAKNGIEDRLRFLLGDLRDIRSLLPAGSFDLVIANPPYYPLGSGRLPAGEGAGIARAEIGCTLVEVCAAASYLLTWGGRFCLVHKPERLTDLLCALREEKMEPKRLRLVMNTPQSPPSLVLAEARRGGRPGLCLEAPLILQSAEGQTELDAIYFRRQEDMP